GLRRGWLRLSHSAPKYVDQLADPFWPFDPHGAGRAREVVDRDHRFAAPRAGMRQDGGIVRFQELQLAPPELGTLLARADRAVVPFARRAGAEALGGNVDALEAVLAPGNRRAHRAPRRRRGKAAVGLRRPLHRRPDRLAFWQLEVVAHADLLAVADDRRAGQR